MSTISASPPWTEAERLAALHSYAVLDTPPEPAFDDIVRLTGQLLEVPMVAINLIDADRQWFKAEIGLGVREMPLDDSICKFTLLEAERMVITDIQDDARFFSNSLVTGAPGLRFYAGELLRSSGGLPLGTLCVLDVNPRPQGLTPLQALTLKTLAQQVLAQLELRKAAIDQDRLLGEQRRTQEELLRTQERSRLATEAAGLGVWSWDSESDVVAWENTRPYEILGLADSEAPPTTRQFMRDYLHADDSAAFAEAIIATLKTAAPFQFEGRMRRRDGSLRWVAFLGSSQPVAEGAAPRIIGVVSDITARKLAEVELRESRERFESIVSQAATGVLQADVDGDITAVNRKLCEMLGYQREELLAMNVLDVTADVSREVTLRALRQLAAGADGVVLQKQYRCKDGSPLWASSSISAVRSASGESHGLVAIVVDISQDRQAEENLRQLAAELSAADQRKSEFLATLAHELRNPLAPICSGLTVLKMGGDDAAAVAKIRGMMERQVAQMVRLIDDLLDVARISGGKIELQKSRVDVRSVVAAAVETSTPFIERGGHRLLLRQPDQPLLLEADAARITQVLSNLLNNAAKYTPPGGLIEVDVAIDGDAVNVSVSDNGIGIPADALSSIFLMFNQVGHHLSRSQGGLGVGLSLVKRLVEMHGGAVVAASAGSGSGSRFTVRLPLAPAA